MKHVHLIAIRDGRDEVHERSVASLHNALPPVLHRVEPLIKSEFVVDDSDHKLGFAGAIQYAWENVPDRADYIFHAELDFLYAAPIPLQRMIELLERRSYLTQVALKRDAVNAEEKAAGGIVECHPDDFHQVHDGGYVFTEHRRFGFTTNPCVYPAALCAQGWPQEAESEGKFGLRLLGDPAAHSCFWGAKFDAPLVEHIGERVGVGY